MDKVTDMCETKGFLQKSVLETLDNYLKDNYTDIIINFGKFYEQKNFDLNEY